jgi:hypothetical protein
MPPAWLWLIFLLLPAVWLLIMRFAAWSSGWSRLARTYRATAAPEGERFRWQSARFGWADYNGCLTLVVAREGLHLTLCRLFSFGHAPLLIPWSDLHVRRVKATGWFPRVEVAVGEPAAVVLTLPYAVLEAAEHLNGRLARQMYSPGPPA